VLANELFDALPVNQAIKQFNGWYERVVEIGHDGNLAFGMADEVIPLFEQLVPPSMRDVPIGAVYEWRADNLPLSLSRRLMHQGGAALVLDYGHVQSAAGDTLQAVGGHAFVDPLQSPARSI
jgi:SAM-dependent MidA family methyltransferase